MSERALTGKGREGAWESEAQPALTCQAPVAVAGEAEVSAAHGEARASQAPAPQVPEAVLAHASGEAPAAIACSAGSQPAATLGTAPAPDAAARARRVPARPHMLRGTLFAATGGICWGFSGTTAQYLSGPLGVDVGWTICVRLAASAVIFFLLAALFKPQQVLGVLRDRSSMLFIVLYALFGMLLTQFSYLLCIAFTNAGTGTLLEQLGLLLVVGVVCAKGRRLPTGREVLGLALALAGTVLIATQGNFGVLSIPPQGLAWGIVSAFSLAGYTLLPARPLAKWNNLVVLAWTMLIAGVAAFAIVQPWNIQVNLTFNVVAALAVLVGLGSVVAFFLFLQGIAEAGSMRAGLMGCLEPVAATIFSSAWLGTSFSGFDVAGCALIVAMMVLVTKSRN